MRRRDCFRAGGSFFEKPYPCDFFASPHCDQPVRVDWRRLQRECRRLLPARAIVAARQELLAYDSDGLMLHRHQTPLVVLPETTEQVSALLPVTGWGCPSWPGAVAPGYPVGRWPNSRPW